MKELRESPRADGKEQIYTHGEKEVFAVKRAMEEGIPVNDNTMLELADLCQYLKLDFGEYFEDYEIADNENMFRGNY